MCCMVR